MGIKSQGTHLYFVDKVTNSKTPALVKMDCPTGISGVGSGAKQQINTTCLDETEAETYVAGLATPSTLSVPYHLNPQESSHQVLNKLKANGENTTWMICLSDGKGVPTLSGEDITAATDRTCIKFTAYVSENSIEIATNDVVKGTVSLQRSGTEIWTYKA